MTAREPFTDRDLDLIEVALEAAANAVQSGVALRGQRHVAPLATEYLHALDAVAVFRGERAECQDCGGVGNDLCDVCDGTGKRGRGRCHSCFPVAGSGVVECPTCRGRGTLTADDAESRGWPTTGGA